MTRTLEQHVQALESGELERLRGLAQRRLERLREAQAMVRELQAQMKAATAELADLQWAERRAIEERDVALAERDEANAKLAAVKFAPGEDMFTYGDMAAIQALYKIGQQGRTLHAELASNGAWRASAYTNDRCCGGEGATVAEAVASIGRKLQ